LNASNRSELVAPCGMNCALCANYLAQKYNVKAKGIKMPTCTGCRPRGKQCAYLKKWCSNLQSGARFCFECLDFPCHRLKTIDNRYRSRYRVSFIANLIEIKEKGMEEFLKAQEQKWKCPTCGGMVCCHNGICFNCGLERLRAKKQKYRWGDEQSPSSA
jgi:hypothetical protein